MVAAWPLTVTVVVGACDDEGVDMELIVLVPLVVGA